MSFESSLDALHARVVSIPRLRGFTAVTRGLLAVAFLPTGLAKALGGRFSSLPLDNPVGYFFDAMYRTGGWWRFIGMCQLLAALLLLLPRSAPTVGALFFLPIILNIFVITVTVGFDGTWVLTGLMLLATLYLVCWDYPRWKGVLFEPSPARVVAPAREPVPWWLTLVTALGVQGGMGALPALMSFRFSPKSLASLGMIVLAGALLLARWVRRRATPRPSAG